MKKIEIIITDDINSDNLIAEIWYNDKIIAEISSERYRQLRIEFNDIKNMSLNLEDVLEAINIAKDKLT